MIDRDALITIFVFVSESLKSSGFFLDELTIALFV